MGPQALGTLGQPGFPFLQPMPLPAPKGGPLPVGALPGHPRAVWFPKAQRLESCFQVGSLPAAPLRLCSLQPLPTLALSPVAEVY